MKLLLTRHGETEYNKERKFYGTADVSLDEKGQRQATILAKKLDQEKPTVLVQTNLRRTRQTLAPLRKRLPYTPIVTLPDLAEKGFGNWEGLDADEIEARYPVDWQKWLKAPLTYTPPTVESFAGFKKRVHRGLSWLLTHATEQDTIAIVAHLGAIRLIYQQLVDPKVYFYDLDFKASCYSLLELKAGKIKRCEMNK